MPIYFKGDALTTDDFLGRIKNSTNLSIKAIIGIGAMAQLAEAAGNKNDEQHYRQTAEKYVKEWMRLSQDPSNKHLLLLQLQLTQLLVHDIQPLR